MPLLFSRRTILAHGAALAASAVTPSLFTSFDASAQVGDTGSTGPIGETDGFGELSQLKKEAEGSVECSH